MRKINILHLAYSDNYGGASVAMKRIHRAISLNENVKSTILIVSNPTEKYATNIYASLIERLWQYLITRVAYKFVNIVQISPNKSGRSINFFPTSILSKLEKYDYDVLHLHWIGNETIKLEALSKISKTIVWTFHDSWALMGAEYTDITKSKRFIEGYNCKNRPEQSKGLDVDRWVWNRKSKVFSNINIHPIVVSSWLYDQTISSYLWRNSSPVIIHNPLDFCEWKILEKSYCRNNNSLKQEETLLVFGAVNAFSDKLKGYKLLEEAVLILSSKFPSVQYRILIFGESEIKEFSLNSNFKIQSIGKINNQNILNSIYCSADLVIVPSFQETFGQVAVEAMACGVPVVAFKTSGLIDIIIEDVNGVFAEPYQPDDLSVKIEKALKTSWNKLTIRNSVKERFGMSIIGKKYVNEYLKYI